MIQNKMRQLTDENDTNSMKLSGEDSALIRRICNYLGVSRLCGYQTEVIRKDLIGMALEAQARGELLKDVLGVSEEEFCRQMAENGQRTGFAEMLFLWIKDFSACNFLLVGIFVFITGNPYTVKAEPGILLMMETEFILSFIFHTFIVPRFSLKKIFKKVLLYVIYAALILPVFILMLLSVSHGGGSASAITIYLVPTNITFGLVWLLSYYLYNKEIQKTAALLNPARQPD